MILFLAYVYTSESDGLVQANATMEYDDDEVQAYEDGKEFVDDLTALLAAKSGVAPARVIITSMTRLDQVTRPSVPASPNQGDAATAEFEVAVMVALRSMTPERRAAVYEMANRSRIMARLQHFAPRCAARLQGPCDRRTAPALPAPPGHACIPALGRRPDGLRARSRRPPFAALRVRSAHVDQEARSGRGGFLNVL